ncbi:hypothetical protein [Streptomyces sp. NBC_00932]|uniref:hypothetical protein n=1 Tax=Streptomyces sp. NBC_00932 TaxID=2903690 RepID=UPI0038676553|nr:hypothetical protein OG221_27725 [Streptomyces sp. NBC_00932]
MSKQSKAEKIVAAMEKASGGPSGVDGYLAGHNAAAGMSLSDLKAAKAELEATVRKGRRG